jgi:hypothetical protein
MNNGKEEDIRARLHIILHGLWICLFGVLTYIYFSEYHFFSSGQSKRAVERGDTQTAT